MQALNAEEAAALDAPHVVHAVDANGVYAGLVVLAAGLTRVSGPPPGEQWRWVAGAWVPAPTLVQAKAQRWADIKAARERHVAGTFTAAGKTYNCNREALTLATHGAMLAKAALDLTWTKIWTLADNTSATLTADQVLTVARAFDDYIGALWVTGRTLRAQIAAATTIAQVEAITWP